MLNLLLKYYKNNIYVGRHHYRRLSLHNETQLTFFCLTYSAVYPSYLAKKGCSRMSIISHRLFHFVYFVIYLFRFIIITSLQINFIGFREGEKFVGSKLIFCPVMGQLVNIFDNLNFFELTHVCLYFLVDYLSPWNRVGGGEKEWLLGATLHFCKIKCIKVQLHLKGRQKKIITIPGIFYTSFVEFDVSSWNLPLHTRKSNGKDKSRRHCYFHQR